MPTHTATTKVVKPEEGHKYVLPEEVMTFKLLSEDTQGQFAVAEARVNPGGDPPPHIHERDDEMWIIVEGTFEFMANDERIVAHPGDIVFSPRYTRHTFKNIGDTQGRFYMVVTGGNFEKFFPRYAAALSEPVINPDKLMAIANEHDIRMAQ